MNRNADGRGNLTVRGLTVRGLAIRCLKAGPLVIVLALGLTLSACDKCGDFFWEKPGSCKNVPAPN
jgi:hypothetical protein